LDYLILQYIYPIIDHTHHAKLNQVNKHDKPIENISQEVFDHPDHHLLAVFLTVQSFSEVSYDVCLK
jgi:hypothetical protein